MDLRLFNNHIFKLIALLLIVSYQLIPNEARYLPTRSDPLELKRVRSILCSILNDGDPQHKVAMSKSLKDACFMNIGEYTNIKRNSREFTESSDGDVDLVGTSMMQDKMFVGSDAGDAPKITHDHLKDHYRHCIKLSASNKINEKNAFVLQLIDYMHDLVKQTDDGQMNFKIASSALDVGAKIYSHRVDCVHSEAQKVASSILMALDGDLPQSKQRQNNNDLNDSNPNDSSGAEEKQEQRKKKRHIKTLADDKAINGSFEQVIIGDSYLDSLTTDYDISSPAALICYNALTQPNCIMTIESHYLCKNYMANDAQVPTIDKAASVSLHTKNNDCAQLIHRNKSKKICVRLENFLFNDRTTTVTGFNQNLDNSRLDFPHNLPTNTQGDHGFDPAVYENNDDYGDDNIGGCDDSGSCHAGDNDIIPNLDKIAAAKTVEYGYIHEPRLQNTWAGPYAWKALKAPLTAKKDLTKSIRKRTKQEQKPIDFNEDINESMEEQGDKELRHSSDQLRKWKKLWLPQDHSMTPDTIRAAVVHTFLRPEDTYQGPKTAAEALKEVNKDHSYSAADNDNSSISPDMMFDNVHDSDDEFRADPVVNGTELAIYGAPINNSLTQNVNDMDFAGENLIEQPFPVTQIHISFAKIAKKMDVRRLKKVMWGLLAVTDNSMNVTEVPNNSDINRIVNGTENNESETTIANVTNNKTISPEPQIHLEFSHLYRDIPPRVSTKMSNDLSQPIAFVTLLHLANEKNLKLTPKDNLKDFVIEQDL